MTENNQKGIQVTNYDKVKALARNEKVISTFAQVVGNKRAAMAYIQSALLAVASNQALMECDPASIMTTALRAATLQLSCDPALGQAYPVPYKGKATLQLGFRGIKQMALRTNKYRFINVSELYEGQVVEENQLTGAVRLAGKRTTDKVIGYFCYFELFNGYSSFLYMTVEELDAHAQRYSKSYNSNSSLWKSEFGKMAKKTVLRLCLLRNGVMTPEDKAVLTSISEDEESADNAGMLDGNFGDIPEDDLSIEPEKTTRPDADILGELEGKKAPVSKGPAITPGQDEQPIRPNEDAPEGIGQPWMFSSDGKPYADMKVKDWSFHINGLMKYPAPRSELDEAKIAYLRQLIKQHNEQPIS
jgi:recombination protein RecT